MQSVMLLHIGMSCLGDRGETVTLKEKPMEKRLNAFYWVAIFTLLILAGRLWYLQIVRGEHFSRLADGNRMRQVRLIPSRGIITERSGLTLARSRLAFTVSLIPGGIPADNVEVIPLLSDILGITIEELQEAIRRGRGYPYEPVRIVRDVDPATVIAIEENRRRLPGVYIDQEAVRDYHDPRYSSHVVGYLGIISEPELQALGASYRGSDLVGKSGIERYYEEQLRGVPGAITVEVNALSRPIQTVNSIEPVPGQNLRLTLDYDLQKAAFDAFETHTEVVRRTYPDAYNGAVIAMDPRTGDILAMASIPGFEPDRLLDAGERNDYYRQLVADPRQPFFDRVTQGQYGPGSTFKPVTAVAILEEGVFGVNDRFHATGVSQYGVRDWVITRGLAPFGWLDLPTAIALSSNHFFADHGAKVGIDHLSQWMRDFGLGARTGLAISPQERIGVVPDRDWKRERFASSAQYDQIWYPSDTEQVSIGQGFVTATPLQMAVVYSSIANRGTAYVPRLVAAVYCPEGELVFESEPEILHELDVSDATWTAVIKGMQGTVTQARGTARSAFDGFPLSVAAKTGSYEVPGRESHGLFGAFAPVDDPEIVVFVVVEHGGGGGSGAAPIARMVMDRYFGFDVEDEQEDEQNEGTAE